jgi:hypothetical protein
MCLLVGLSLARAKKLPEPSTDGTGLQTHRGLSSSPLSFLGEAGPGACICLTSGQPSIPSTKAPIAVLTLDLHLSPSPPVTTQYPHPILPLCASQHLHPKTCHPRVLSEASKLSNGKSPQMAGRRWAGDLLSTLFCPDTHITL